MNKTLGALLIAGSSILYSGCRSGYEKYYVDWNTIEYKKESFSKWNIIETKNDGTKIKYSLNSCCGTGPYFRYDHKNYQLSDKIGSVLNKRAEYILQNIKLIDSLRVEEQIKKLTK